MNKFGPTKSDLHFRLIVSIAGLALLAALLAIRGMPTGLGGWEAVTLAAIFFGGTFVWTLRKLLRKDYSDGS